MTGWRAWAGVYLGVAAFAVAAHLPELGGWVSCDPLHAYPGMVQAVQHRLLPGRCSMDGNDGMTLQALGGGAAELWLQGRLPWWNSLAGLGLPLAAEAQPAAFFLPFVLLLHFFAGLLMLKITLQVLAGTCMVAFLRELGVGRAGATAGGMLFALNGSFAWFADAPILPIAFLPALLFGLERCRVRALANRTGGPAWVTLALAFSLLAGFPETAFMDGLLAALWAAVAVLRLPAARRLALVGKIAAGGLAGLALAAPAWVSFLDYLRIASVGIHLLVTGNHLALDQAPALLMPTIYGPPFAEWAPAAWSDDGGYFGAALGMLALLGMLSGPRWRAIRAAMAGWIAVWLGVFLGAPVVHTVWAALPPLNAVQVTRYAMPSLECAAAVLAALAVSNWRAAVPGARAAWAGVAFAVLAGAALVLGWRGGRLSFGTDVLRLFHLAAVAEAVVVVAMLARLLSGPATPRRLRLLLLLAAADAAADFAVPELAGTTPNRLDLAPTAFLRAHAGLSRVFSLNEQFPVNYGSWFGVAQIQAVSIPFAQAWDDAALHIGGDINMGATGWLVITPAMQLAALRAALPRLRQAGVRYIVAAVADDPLRAQPEPGLVAVFADAGTRIYEMADAAPYAEMRGGACRLTVTTRERMWTQCAAPAMLLRRELPLPGWHARVNGRKAAIAESDGMFQLVAVPAGRSDIDWRYRPPHDGLIVGLFGLGLAATLWMGAGQLTRPPARRAPRRRHGTSTSR